MMKKLFVLAIAMVFAFGMNAQKIGAKVGYGMSGYLVNFYVPDGAKMAMGPTAGLIGEYGLNDMLGIRLDVGYNTLGSDYEETIDILGVSTEYKFKTDVAYLNVGVSAKASFGPAYAFVGPYFGYGLKNETKGTIKVAGIGIPFDNIDNWADPVDGGSGDLENKIDFGANLGVGVSLGSMFVEANAGMGLANFINTGSQYYPGADTYPSNEAGDPISGDAKQKNLFFGLSFGYLFGF